MVYWSDWWLDKCVNVYVVYFFCLLKGIWSSELIVLEGSVCYNFLKWFLII